MGSKQGSAMKEKQHKSFDFKEMIKKNYIESIEKEYELLEKIGSGTYSQVYKAQSIKIGNIRAVKKVHRVKAPHIERMLINEFEILKEIDHPNILKMHQFYQDHQFYYIITELIQGRELFAILQDQKKIQEEMAFNIFYQAVLAITYLHKNQVIHRDLKLENMVYDEKEKILKIIDFGNSVKFSSVCPCERRCTGTIPYIAPEVINKFYNMKCDIWSLGILLFVMLSGNAPFLGNSNEEIIFNICKEPLHFTKPVWETVSKECKTLLTKMLEKNFQKRISLAEIRKDPWFKANLSKIKLEGYELEFLKTCFMNMKRFQNIKISEIQVGILIFMVNFIVKIKEEHKLIKAFNWIDLKGDGVICEDELQVAIGSYLGVGSNSASELAVEIMNKIDLNHSKEIDYSEFLIASIDLREVLTDQNIKKTFFYMDEDGSGALSIDQLKAKLGHEISDQYYRQIIKQFDTGNAQINQEQFHKMMKKILAKY